MTEIYSEKYSFQKSSKRTRGNKGLLAVSWEHRNEKVRVNLYSKTDDEHSKSHYVICSLQTFPK